MFSIAGFLWTLGTFAVILSVRMAFVTLDNWPPGWRTYLSVAQCILVVSVYIGFVVGSWA